MTTLGNFSAGALALVLFSAAVALADPTPAAQPSPAPALELADTERLVTILATNDIHGGVEPTKQKDGTLDGGLSFWSGAVRAIRAGLTARFGDHGGVALVDGGDQFQGTLISNYDEGQLIFAAMNQVGYDAAVPGNHDFDFGPIGWLQDRVTADSPDQNPRGALERLVGQATFPLLSANTYQVDSLIDTLGNPVKVSKAHCTPAAPGAEINWAAARRLAIFRPYLLKNVAGVRVAFIGIDNVDTPSVTTVENVSDLCFRDELDTYAEVRATLAGQADVFVMVIHNGNSDTEFPVSNLVIRIAALGDGMVDAVVAGHTHFVNNALVKDVPIIQSGSGGELFGRIDLVWDTNARKLVRDKRRVLAGIRMLFDRCAPSSKSFCQVIAPAAEGATPVVAYEGVTVQADPAVDALIRTARARIEPIAGRKLGVADADVKRDRVSESPEVAFMNSGGLRADLPAGDVTYEDLFKVIPFSNHGVEIGPMPAANLLALLSRSVLTCGNFGALMQSGLRVTYERDCRRAVNGVDPLAHLVHVETVSGELIFDLAQGGMQAPASRVFAVTTLDFLASGGSGFDGFIGSPLVRDLGIVREVLTEKFLLAPAQFSSKQDGRWQDTLPFDHPGTSGGQ